MRNHLDLEYYAAVKKTGQALHVVLRNPVQGLFEGKRKVQNGVWTVIGYEQVLHLIFAKRPRSDVECVIDWKSRGCRGCKPAEPPTRLCPLLPNWFLSMSLFSTQQPV